jgi:hypothetical protein
MKLRLRQNSLRLRLNQKEVELLAAGCALEEGIVFPNESRLLYRLSTTPSSSASADFSGGIVTVTIPEHSAIDWQSSTVMGLYYKLDLLQVAIEKDLQCRDLPPEEQDPHAYPRQTPAACS